MSPWGGCCSPGWKSSISLLTAAAFPHLPTSDSSRVTKLSPKMSQLRQQNSVSPALLRSLAPALTPPLLVLPLLTCGSPVVLYKVCGARNRAPRSEYVPVCVCPAIEETNTGWKDYGGKNRPGKKCLCLQNNLILQSSKLKNKKIKSDLNSHIGNKYKLPCTSFVYTQKKTQ